MKNPPIPPALQPSATPKVGDLAVAPINRDAPSSLLVLYMCRINASGPFWYCISSDPRIIRPMAYLAWLNEARNLGWSEFLGVFGHHKNALSAVLECCEAWRKWGAE